MFEKNFVYLQTNIAIFYFKNLKLAKMIIPDLFKFRLVRRAAVLLLAVVTFAHGAWPRRWTWRLREV